MMLRAAQLGPSSSLLVAFLALATTAVGRMESAQVVASGASAPTAAGARGLTVRLIGTVAEDAWLEITPLLSQAEPTLISLATGKQEVGVPNVPAGPLLVCAGARDRATGCVRWLEGSDALSIALLPGTRVVGRCVRDGKPVVGAKISVVPARLTARRAFTVPLQRRSKRVEREVTSDASGSFALARISPGEYLLQVVSPGGRIQTGEPFVVRRSNRSHPETTPGIPTLDLGEFVVEGGAALAVVVTDNVGVPLPGATVGANQGALPNVTFFSSVANEEGRATLSGFDPLLPVTVVCQKPGFNTLRQSFDSLPATVVCALDPLATITGSVTNSEGDAVPRATVSLRDASRTARSDGRGAFKLTDVAAGNWDVVVASPGFDVAKRSVEVRPGETRDLGRIELARGTEVQGLVRDAQSQQPVPEAFVVCESPPGLGQTTTGLDGTFTLALPRQERSVLAVTAQGYPTTRRTVGLDQLDAEQQVVIELSEGGRLLISAWDDETDAPCTGCSVSVSAPGSRVGSLITDSNGEAQSAPLAPGAYNVSLGRLRTTGIVFQMSGGDAQRWVDVKTGFTTHVQLGSPLTQVKVHLTATPSPEWALIGTRVSGLSPGQSLGGSSYLVKFRRGESMGLWLHSAGGSRVLVGALRADFEGMVAEFDLPQSSVRGQLIAKGGGGAGQSLDLLTYEAGQVVATVVTLTGGFFSCPYLPRGMYTVVANRTVLRTFSLAHQQQLDVGQLELPTP